MAEQQQERSLAVALAEKYEMKTEAFLETVKKTVMPSLNVSNEHLAAFLMVAKEHDLNPMTEQIHAFPSKGGVKAMIGVDGYIALANRHPKMDGMQTILNRDTDGKVYSATCTIYRKDREHPTVIEEDLAECRRDTIPWKQHPNRMLRHKAIMQCVRVAFGGANLTDEDEARDQGYDPDSRTMKNVPPEKKEGTGLLDQLSTEKDGGWPRLRYGDKPISEPQDTQPDPDTIITEQADVVDLKPEKKTATKAKTPSEKIKEMAEEKSRSESLSDLVNESESESEMECRPF